MEATDVKELAYQAKSKPFYEKTMSKPLNGRMVNCRYCGNNHQKGTSNCPAYGKICLACNRKNHFSSVCRSRQSVRQVDDKDCRDDHYKEDNDYREDQKEEVMQLKTTSKPKKQLFVRLQIGNNIIKFQLDSGATCNVMSLNDLKKLLQTDRPALSNSAVMLNFYGGSSQRSLGSIVLKSKFKKRHYDLRFEILDTEKCPLIGAADCLRLGLILTDDQVFQAFTTTNKSIPITKSVHTLFDRYPDVFEGLGCFEGMCNIALDGSVNPTVVAPRRHPLALKNEINDEIERLLALGVIVKVTEPTDWVSNSVIVKKPNKLRLCIDPHHLNRAIKRSHYQTPTIEEIMPKLANAKVFSVLDLKDGFWHVKLTEEASRLTTFWTPKGRFRWTRLPFGLSNAPEEFQRRVHENIEGLNGVVAIADDVMVYGSGATTEQAKCDHDRNLEALLKRAQARGFKFNQDKCKVGLNQVTYMGHLLTSNGLKPDPKKVESIGQLKRPTTKNEVKRFLGYIVYLSKFLPKLSEIATPLRYLLKEDSEWIWESPQEMAFTKLIKLVQEAPTLKYFDETQNCTLQCDASQYGLGACLMQDGRPVAYASRTLTATETSYAQIEKECLAIVFGLQRFEQYVFGKRNVLVESDHKPLEAIFKKPLIAAPKRLQRMLLQLQRYNFHVVYKPGNSMHVADFLSRAPLAEQGSENNNTLIFQSELEDISMLDYINITDERIKEVQEATKNCSVMKKLISVIQKGWPEKRSELPKDILDYWGVRDELSVSDGVIVKGERLVIPTSLRTTMIKILHTSHHGVESCLRRARQVIFWPGLAKDIKLSIEKCWACQKYAPSQRKEPLFTHEIPHRPWQRVGVDFFQLNNDNYIIMSDYYSSFFELKKIYSLKAVSVIEFFKEQFARHGIPDVVVSDSGSQIVSNALQEFARQWKFKVLTSSPYNHQSNGKAESAVKQAKALIKKVQENREDLYIALLEWRNTPIATLNASPAQLLMSRRTKTLMPSLEKSLRPRVENNVESKLKVKQDKYKVQYDKGTRSLEPLTVGQEILVQKRPDFKGEPWVKGSVINKEGPRTYLLSVEGRLYRRNRRFIKTYERV